MASRKANQTPAAECRAPSAAERVAIVAAQEAQKARPARPSMKYEAKGDKATLGPPHSDAGGAADHLSEAFGTSSNSFLLNATGWVASFARASKTAPTQTENNAGLALMAAIAPKDEFECAIAQQIIAAHFTGLTMLDRARANVGQYPDAAGTYANMANKTMRTMGSLVETLARLRSGGKQQVEVRYVYVDARTQTVVNGEGARPEIGASAHAPGFAGLALAPGLPVWGQDPEGHAMSGTSDQG